MITDRLTHMKKPKTEVSIDIPGRFVNKIADVISPALTLIVNAVRMGGKWPKLWSQEEVTILPKTSSPASYDECRNVSCTSLFSKLCESFMLEMIHEEIQPEPHQFGGRRGVGPDHLLSELITNIMETLDDNRSCASLISVDMSKAFNRVDHNVCLQAMAEQGASNQTLKMTASFLEERI